MFGGGNTKCPSLTTLISKAPWRKLCGGVAARAGTGSSSPTSARPAAVPARNRRRSIGAAPVTADLDAIRRFELGMLSSLIGCLDPATQANDDSRSSHALRGSAGFDSGACGIGAAGGLWACRGSLFRQALLQ